MGKRFVTLAVLIASAFAYWVLIDILGWLIGRSIYYADWFRGVFGYDLNPYRYFWLRSVPSVFLAAFPIALILLSQFKSRLLVYALIVSSSAVLDVVYNHGLLYPGQGNSDLQLSAMHLCLRLVPVPLYTAAILRWAPSVQRDAIFGQAYALVLFFAPFLVPLVIFATDYLGGRYVGGGGFWLGIAGVAVGLMSLSHYLLDKSSGRKAFVVISVFWGALGSLLTWSILTLR